MKLRFLLVCIFFASLIAQHMAPPSIPELYGVAYDGYIKLSWNQIAEDDIDPKTGYADFAGYRLYKSTDGGQTWGQAIYADVNDDGINDLIGWQPTAQFDLTSSQDETRCLYINAFYDEEQDVLSSCLDNPDTIAEDFIDEDGNDLYDYGEDFTDTNDNGFWDLHDESVLRSIEIKGQDPISWIGIDLGNNSGLEGNSYYDYNVINGVEYTYAITSYDMGVRIGDIYYNDINGDGYWQEGELIDSLFWDASNPDHFTCLYSQDLPNNPNIDNIYGCPSFESPINMESFTDYNANGIWDSAEDFTDSNGNNLWDDAEPFIDATNGQYDEGEFFIDQGNGIWDDDESFSDEGNGIWNDGEEFEDELNDAWNEGEDFIDGNEEYDEGEEFEDTDGDGVWNDAEEYIDTNDNGMYDDGEEFTDSNGNGAWDDAEQFTDELNGIYDIGEEFSDALNGIWDSAEEFTDVGNEVWDDAEPFLDQNGNGIWDYTELYTDQNNNGQWDDAEEYTDNDGNGEYTDGDPFVDEPNGVYDLGEEFIDGIMNEVWDNHEPFIDLSNGQYDEGELFYDEGNALYDDGEVFIDEVNGTYDDGEEFEDINENEVYDYAEDFNDVNNNGMWNGSEEVFVDNDGNGWDERENPINIVTVVPSPDASNITYPDSDDTENFIIENENNVGTGERVYEIVDENSFSPDIVKLEVQTDMIGFRCENPDYLIQSDCENAGWEWTDEDGHYDDYEKSRTRDPYLYVYKVDGLDTQKLVEGDFYSIDLELISEEDINIYMDRPGAQLSNDGLSIQIPNYLITPVSLMGIDEEAYEYNFSSWFNGIKVRFDNYRSLPELPQTTNEANIDTILFYNSLGEENDSLAYHFGSYGNENASIRLDYYTNNAYKSRPMFNYLIEFGTSFIDSAYKVYPNGDNCIDICEVDGAGDDCEDNLPYWNGDKSDISFLPFKITNLKTNRHVRPHHRDFGVFSGQNDGSFNGTSGYGDCVWNRNESLYFAHDSVAFAEDETDFEDEKTFILTMNYSIFTLRDKYGPDEDGFEYTGFDKWDETSNYEAGEIVEYCGLVNQNDCLPGFSGFDRDIWMATRNINGTEDNIQAPNIIYDEDGDNVNDSPWKQLYPWEDGDYMIISPEKWYQDGDSWVADLSLLGQRSGISQSSLDLIEVVPNPFKVSSLYNYNDTKSLIFNNLPNECRINIYTITGEHVEEIEFGDSDNLDGTAFWDLKNKSGSYVVSGLYIYTVEVGDLEPKIGKFVIVK